MRRINIVLFMLCTVMIIAGCGTKNAEKSVHESYRDNSLDFSKIDRLSLWVGNDELFTEDKEIINIMFPKNSVYKQTDGFSEEYAGGWIINAYCDGELLYEMVVYSKDFPEIEVNGITYIVDIPGDYERVSSLIQEENNLVDNEIPDFSKIDRLSLWVGNDELFTEDKEIINKMFPKDSVYTEQKDYDTVIYGCSNYNAYNGQELLYSIVVALNEDKYYVNINDKWYAVENPPEYEEISGMIQKEHIN